MNQDGVSSQLINSMDEITDPSLLARTMLDLPAQEEQVVYPRQFRASMMGTACVRERVLGYRSCLIYKKRIDIGLQVTFDIGNAIHDFLQNQPKYLGHRLVGWWECQACGHLYWGMRRKQQCPQCGARSRAYRYKEHEVSLTDPYLASGHQDMFWELSPVDIRIGDLKTISAKEYKTLSSPKPNHVLQVLTYMILSEYDKTLPVPLNLHKGFLFYISKQHHFKGLPFKAFTIDRSKLIREERFIRGIYEAFTRGVNDPTYFPPCLPSCLESNFTSRMAKDCPVRQACIEASPAGK
jgi:hypothetical protein